MNLQITDHHPLPTVKLLSSTVPGLHEPSSAVVQILLELFTEHHTDVVAKEFESVRTLESVKQRYARNDKFYYPRSLYVTVTVRSHARTYATLNLNKDNLHTLDVYTENVEELLTKPNTLMNVVDALRDATRKYKFLL